MRGFLEQYGVAIFVLVLVSILISFASPLGNTIKTAINNQIASTEEIGKDAVENTRTYTIIFDGNGATSGSMEQIDVKCGKKFKLPECKFKKDDAEFSGIWSTKQNYVSNVGKGYVLGTNYQDIANQGETITLYAIWGYRMDLQNVLDGTIGYWGHNYGTCDLYINGKLKQKNVSDFNEILQIGDTYEITNIKATKGHNYSGVYSGYDSSGRYLQALPLYGICTGKFPNGLYLIFNSNTYTITYHANATDVVGTTASSHHTYDKSAPLTQNGFTRSGYTFLGWNTSADGSGTSYTDMQEVKNLTDQNNVNIDLYAMWQKN